MNIDREHYQLYFMDYLDGNLDPGEIRVLQSFLEDNPDLAEELESWKEFCLSPRPAPGRIDKDALKEMIFSDTCRPDEKFDEICLAEMDGDLTSGQSRTFNTLFLNDPEKKKQYELLKKTILRPDPNIRFRNKSSLRKFTLSTFGKRYWPLAGAVAAGLAIMLLITRIGDKTLNHQPVPQASTIKSESGPMQEEPGGVQTGTHVPRMAKLQKLAPATIKKIPPRDEAAEVKQKPVRAPANRPEEDLTVPARLDPLGPEKLICSFTPALRTVPPGKYTRIPEGKFLTPGEFALQKIRETVDPDFSKLPGSKPSLLDIVSLGLNGLGKMTGSEFYLERQYNEQAELAALVVNTPIFGFVAPVRKNKP